MGRHAAESVMKQGYRVTHVSALQPVQQDQGRLLWDLGAQVLPVPPAGLQFQAKPQLLRQLDHLQRTAADRGTQVVHTAGELGGGRTRTYRGGGGKREGDTVSAAGRVQVVFI